MLPEPLSARELARRLIAHDAAGDAAPAGAAAAARLACERAFRDLSRWVGTTGSHAVFARALAQARTEHPSLGEIRLAVRSEAALEGMDESIQAHGASAVAAGLEALLVALLELLDRLVGGELATRIVEPGAPDRARGEEGAR